MAARERADALAADGCEVEVAVGKRQVEASDAPRLEQRVHGVEATLGRHEYRDLSSDPSRERGRGGARAPWRAGGG
eukprot:1252679-Prymnesium_polylepis.1